MATTDAHPVPIRDTAIRITFPILDADGDLVTAATALDSEFSEDAVGFADATAEATEIATSSGMYYLELTAGEMGGDTVAVIVKTTSSGAKTTPIVLYPQSAANPILVDVQAVSGDATAANNLELDYDGTGYAKANSTIGTVTTNSDKTGYALSAAGVDAIWDEPVAAHTTLATFGQIFMAVGARTGEVNDVAALTTDFDVDGFTEATNDHFNGMLMVFTSGALLGQGRVITDYVGAAQNCVFGEAWTEAPANNDDFVILPGPVLGGTLSQVLRLFVTILDQSTGQIDAGSFAAGAIDATAIATNAIDADAMADNAITAATFAAGAIDAAAIATNAIDADALAADAVDEIWDEALVEPGGVPAVTAAMRSALAWMLALSRNKITQTATSQALRNDADGANIATSAVSDDGTTAIRAEWV